MNPPDQSPLPHPLPWAFDPFADGGWIRDADNMTVATSDSVEVGALKRIVVAMNTRRELLDALRKVTNCYAWGATASGRAIALDEARALLKREEKPL